MANNVKWVFDPAHSEITFKVKHLMITNVKGEFKKFDATLSSDDGKIYRNDFGLTWNAALETGGVLVSEDVKIAAEIQFVKQLA